MAGSSLMTVWLCSGYLSYWESSELEWIEDNDMILEVLELSYLFFYFEFISVYWGSIKQLELRIYFLGRFSLKGHLMSWEGQQSTKKWSQYPVKVYTHTHSHIYDSKPASLFFQFEYLFQDREVKDSLGFILRDYD